MDADLTARLAMCERTNRRLMRLITGQFVLLAILGASLVTGGVSGQRATGAAGAPPGPLRATELVVVDGNGVERVRIGGDLPDAVINGKRVPRGEKAAGLLIYDGSGQERGGYVTWEPSGNAGLTLDTRQRQVALLVAGPDSAAALQLSHGKDAIELRSDEDGSRLTGARGGQVVVQEPSVSQMSEPTCQAYRGAVGRVSMDRAMQDCRRRFTDGTCRACLGAR